MLYLMQAPPSNLSLWLSFWSPIVTPLVMAIVALLTAYAMKMQASMKQQVSEIHTFTNSALGASKRATAAALRLLATQTHDPKDAEAATLAEADSAAHDASQKLVDSAKTK